MGGAVLAEKFAGICGITMSKLDNEVVNFIKDGSVPIDSEEFKTENGENVTIYKYEHILPKNKKLLSVSLEQDETNVIKVFLCRAEGIKIKKTY